MRKKNILARILLTIIAFAFAVAFLLPTVLTITNSFMTQSEISANYGVIFSGGSKEGSKTYMSERVNLKFIPDKVSFSQYGTVLIKSPAYLLKFWNSVILVLPIVVFQIAIAALAAYGFTRYRGPIREAIFFFYVILMLMPYQVTLVPNYLVSKWLGLLDTRWAIVLPGVFAPFSVEIHAAHPSLPDRGRQARRGGGVADLHAHLPAAVPQRPVFHRAAGVHRLLEHGRAAHHPAVRHGAAPAERVPLEDQFRRDRTCVRRRDHLYGAYAAAVPPRRGIPGGGHHLLWLREGLKECLVYD